MISHCLMSFPSITKRINVPYFMPAMFSCCAGIHVQAIHCIIIHHFQNMRMPADKECGRCCRINNLDAGLYLGGNPPICIINTFTCSQSHTSVSGYSPRISYPSILPYTPRKGLKAFNESEIFCCAKIAGVPDLIAMFKMFEYCIIEVIMCNLK